MKHCSGIGVPEPQFVSYLRETFPDSMSRASHVRLAEEPDSRRRAMVHTCTEKRSDITQNSKRRLVLASSPGAHRCRSVVSGLRRAFAAANLEHFAARNHFYTLPWLQIKAFDKL